MDDNALWIQAAQVRAATGGNIREIFKKLKENPPKQETAAAKPEPVVAVKFKATDFYREVEKLMDTRNLSYVDAYKRVRRDNPALFDAMLTAVNR